MNILMTLIGVTTSLFVFLLTIISAFALRKPRKISILGTLISGLIALLALLIVLLLSGMRINWLLAVPTLFFGMLIGFLRGQFVKFRMLGKQVIAYNSILIIILWGFSLGISLLLGLLDPFLLASLGLLPVFFSSGLQMGISTNFFLRRILVYLVPSPPRPGGLTKTLNLDPHPMIQQTTAHPGNANKVANKNIGAIVFIILVNACLLVASLSLAGMVIWQTFNNVPL